MFIQYQAMYHLSFAVLKLSFESLGFMSLGFMSPSGRQISGRREGSEINMLYVLIYDCACNDKPSILEVFFLKLILLRVSNQI